MAYCSSCGAALNDGAAFCGSCGKTTGTQHSDPVAAENTAGSNWTQVPSVPVTPSSSTSGSEWTPAPVTPLPVPASSSNRGWSQVPSQPVVSPAGTSGSGWTPAPVTPSPIPAASSDQGWSQVPSQPIAPPGAKSGDAWTPPSPTATPPQAGSSGPAWTPTPPAAPGSGSAFSPIAAQPSAMPGVVPIAASTLTPNVAGALAYLLGLITGVLFLVIEPYRRDRFVRFHAMQSILFTFAWIVIQMGWRIVWGILLNISGSLYLVGAPLRLLISLGLFLYWLYVMYQAYQQKEYRIPIIGAIAAQQAGQ